MDYMDLDVKVGHVALWVLLQQPSWHPLFESSYCNSLEDPAPLDLVYVCLLLEKKI